MAVDKLVDSTQLDSDLTSIANAIRAKTGGSSQIAFPSGFVSGIGGLADPSGTTAVAADVAQGKYFLTSAGVLTQGTASGGGGSSYTLVASAEYAVSTTKTSATSTGELTDVAMWAKDKILYVKVRDKAGKRNGYFFGSDTFLINYELANGETTSVQNAFRFVYRIKSDGTWGYYLNASTTGYGVYANDIYPSGKLRIYQRYNSTYSLTINGTYKVEVYLLDWPGNVSPYA